MASRAASLQVELDVPDAVGGDGGEGVAEGGAWEGLLEDADLDHGAPSTSSSRTQPPVSVARAMATRA
jgi:hypothetical protein